MKYKDFEYKVLEDSTIEITRCVGKTKSIVIPNEINGIDVTSIGDSAFFDCESLKSIKIPNSVAIIEDFAFANCKSLKSIELPNSITSIGDAAFPKDCKIIILDEKKTKNKLELDKE